MKTLTHSRLPKPAKGKPKPKPKPRPRPTYEQIRRPHSDNADAIDKYEAAQRQYAAQHDRAIRDYSDDLLTRVALDIIPENPAREFESPAEKAWFRGRRAAVYRALITRNLLPLALS